MARASRAQSRAPSSIGIPSRRSTIGLATVPILSLIVVAILLALPDFSLGRLRQWLFPTFISYLPQQPQAQLPHSPNNGSTPIVNKDASLNSLLTACQTYRYSTQIISLDPLVIYINNFTSALEAEELIKLGSPEFAESFISRGSGTTHHVTGRTSQSAPLPITHPLVECLLNRARSFMGSMLLPSEPFSVPQLVRYFPSQRYDLHTDFWPQHQITTREEDRREVQFNRVASFFVFLRDNCTNGYTYFPLVEPPLHTDIETLYRGKVARGDMDGEIKGVKFKPIQGNAVFWINSDKEGNGDRRVVHAGLPVAEGEKIGLNIWPRKYFGPVDNDGSREEGYKKRYREGWSGKWKE